MPPTAGSRFKEGSLDSVNKSVKSTDPVLPPTSPRVSPAKEKPRDSPSKGSPARAKFEHIAERVGIKVSRDKEAIEPASPPGKRRWRDVWRGSKKDGSVQDAL